MNKSVLTTLLCASVSTVAFSGGMGSEESLPNSIRYIGVGGSYNSVNLINQQIWAKGVTSAYSAGALASTGSASEYSNPFNAQQNIIAPHLQAGYSKYFGNNAYFLGMKFSYDYVDSTISDNNKYIPQAGANTTVSGQVTYFTGNEFAETVQTGAQHELLLLAYIGQSFKSTSVYFGAGPSLFGMHSNIYRITGYADYKGVQGTNITGQPADLSQSSWQWGGAGQVGATYAISPTWMLDFNYTYATTSHYTNKYVQPFTNTAAGDNIVGTNYVQPSQRVAINTFALSINRVF